MMQHGRMTHRLTLGMPLDQRPFSVREARELGFGRARMRNRELSRPFHGVRAQAEVEHPVAAFAPRLRRNEWFSHESAARLWGVPLPDWERSKHGASAGMGLYGGESAGVDVTIADPGAPSRARSVTTPMTVAVSRHNNPDALLVLCCVAALWCAVRAFDDGRTRWLVLAGLLVGLGFETKMAVALTVVPGIALAWLLVAPRGRLHALRQLLAGGAAMLVAGGAWPALVALTPASNRPWISGTSDNSILSLIFGYNGLGRVDGQAGGPGGIGGGSVFTPPTGGIVVRNSPGAVSVAVSRSAIALGAGKPSRS